MIQAGTVDDVVVVGTTSTGPGGIDGTVGTGTVGLGFLTHIAGDLLTVEGVPAPTWPVQITPPKVWDRTPVLNAIWKRNGYVSVPLLGHAGSWRETALGAGLGLYCVYAVVIVVARAAHVSLTALG